jgi:hypothetical protein
LRRLSKTGKKPDKASCKPYSKYAPAFCGGFSMAKKIKISTHEIFPQNGIHATILL